MWGPVVVRGDFTSKVTTPSSLLQMNFWCWCRNCRRATGGSSLSTWPGPCFDSLTTCLLAILKHVFREAKHTGVKRSLWEIQTWLLPKVIQHNHPQRNETLTSPDLQAVTAVTTEKSKERNCHLSANATGLIAPFTPPPLFLSLQTGVLSHQARDHLGNEDSFYS